MIKKPRVWLTFGSPRPSFLQTYPQIRWICPDELKIPLTVQPVDPTHGRINRRAMDAPSRRKAPLTELVSATGLMRLAMPSSGARYLVAACDPRQRALISAAHAAPADKPVGTRQPHPRNHGERRPTRRMLPRIGCAHGLLTRIARRSEAPPSRWRRQPRTPKPRFSNRLASSPAKP